MGGVDFRRVLEEAHEAQLVLDADARLVTASDGYLRTVGWSRADALGRSVFDLPPYAEVPVAARALREAMATMQDAALAMTALLLNEDSVAALSPFVKGELRAVRGDEGQIVQFVHTLERTSGRAERSRSDSDRRLEKLIEKTYDAVALFDAHGRPIYVSPTIERVLGYSAKEFAEKNPIETIHPDDRQRFGEEIRQLFQNPGGQLLTQFRAQHKDGHWCTLENAAVNRVHDPDVGATVSTFRDVTKQVELQAELRRSGERLRIALGAARALSWEVELATGRGFYSGDFGEFFGFPRGLDFEDAYATMQAIHPDDRDRLSRTWQRCTETGESFTIEFRGLERGHETRWYASHGQVLYENGKAARLVGVMWDVSERRHLEQRMQESQKLESLGVLAGGIAHDFNNLLMVMLGNVSLVRADLGGPHPVLEHVDQIEEAARRATDLCRQLLAYAGKGRFVLQRTNLNQLIDEVTNLLSLSISKKAALRFHLEPDLPAIVADATQMGQVLMNLVINASDAIGDKNGTISISTGVVRADRSYLDTTFLAPDIPAGVYVFLEVSDTGEGMSPETQARIFEPFFSTKFTGRGLGLAAVLGIVRGHKGALKVYSEVGRGSSFKFLLPAVDGAALRDRASSQVPENTALDGTILVVDDEEPVRLVAGKLLSRMGFRTLMAADGHEAIRVYREHLGQIQCVLMDLTMPSLDGEEAFRELRRIDPNACVMLMSGYNEQDAIARFVGKGVAGFIQKPFTMAELEQRLRRLMSTEHQEG
jgi:PAS domain S-box-containing protein